MVPRGIRTVTVRFFLAADTFEGCLMYVILGQPLLSAVFSLCDPTNLRREPPLHCSCIIVPFNKVANETCDNLVFLNIPPIISVVDYVYFTGLILFFIF